jgi:hypothetical protein
MCGEKEFRNVFFLPVRVYYAIRLTLQQLISFVIINWAKASLFFFYGGPVSEGYGAGTLYVNRHNMLTVQDWIFLFFNVVFFCPGTTKEARASKIVFRRLDQVNKKYQTFLTK